MVVGTDMNGLWVSQATKEETLQAVLVKWDFLDSVVSIIELERPRGRLGFEGG